MNFLMVKLLELPRLVTMPAYLYIDTNMLYFSYMSFECMGC